MGKLWRIDGQSPNSPMFYPANVLRYTVLLYFGYKKDISRITPAPFIANTGVDNSARSSPSVDLDSKEYVPCIEPATWPVTVALRNKASLMLASVLCACCAVSSNLRTELDQQTSWHLLLHEIHSKCTNNARDVL